MKTLTILYDTSCGFCVSCRRWLEEQPAYLPLRFLPARSRAAAGLFPELCADVDELVVVSDEGYVYRGGSAWIMCLWVLQDFRPWALRLSTPALLPLARQAFGLLSRNRKSISRRLGLLPEGQLTEMLQDVPTPTCSRSTVPPSSH